MACWPCPLPQTDHAHKILHSFSSPFCIQPSPVQSRFYAVPIAVNLWPEERGVYEVGHIQALSNRASAHPILLLFCGLQANIHTEKISLSDLRLVHNICWDKHWDALRISWMMCRGRNHVTSQHVNRTWVYSCIAMRRESTQFPLQTKYATCVSAYIVNPPLQ